MDEKDSDFLLQYGLLYEKHAPDLIFYARKFVSEFVAEDIVHDVFLTIWSKKSFFIIDETISNYLFRAVQNSCLNRLKRQAIEQDFIARSIVELKIEELNTSSIEDSIHKEEQLHEIYNVIKQLPEKCKNVFQLSFFEDKKNSEIASLLNISVRTVEAHLYKALLFLRKELLSICIGIITLWGQ